MSVCPTILIVDDEQNTRDGLRQYLEGLDYDVLTASGGEEALQIYKSEKPDLVLTDIRMPELDGISLMEKIIRIHPAATVILLTAYGTVEDAVKTMKKGAYYYLTKPVNLDELEFLVKKALASQSLVEENRELRQALFTQKFDQGDILTQSVTMREVLKTVEQIAQSDSTVLIEGESGTGKELIANRIHQQSPRRKKPFIAVHCAALTETLLSSELFGHEKGAFTGATERKVGRFERAHEGTLFLDEIGEISKETQVKLLRVLQEGEFERVGGTKTLKVNVRLVCATNKKLIKEVHDGHFREDLFYRINVIYLEVPPLRERKKDIPLLVDHFLKYFSQVNAKKITGISPDALASLQSYPWPGNVRELKNIVERMVVLSRQEQLELTNVPEDIRGPGRFIGAPSSAPSSQVENISDMEKKMILQTLAKVNGNKSLAAKKLGISRRTLYRKISQYQI